MIKAFIGLGNSGAEYEKTYHNVGEFVATQLSIEEEAQGLLGSVRRYPVTGFMNESGGPVTSWMKKNNVAIGECVIIHDDSDLPLGQFKLVRGGGSAGHKGIESLVAHFGTEDFWRLRIGVRDPKEQIRRKAGEFVLSRWSAAEETMFRQAATEAYKAIAVLNSADNR